MRKSLFISLALSLCAAVAPGIHAAVPAYDQEAALASARADVANWQKYLPDEVYVAHVSIPGTHDAATGHEWASATGPTYSTTQEKTLAEQLAGGIRAFDFRPGMTDGILYCNHGTDRLKLTLDEAFTVLTDYLDAHPSEFYVIHLFRGNIYRTGEASTGNKFLGAKDDAASQSQYNELFNQFFNQKYNNYIVEYSPYLKVADIRGKIVVFRRDRIDFAHIAKGGNLSNWPGAEEQWSAANYVTATNATDGTIWGRIFATDVSSPDDAAQLDIELSSMTDLFNYNCTQPNPNDAKRAQGIYKPDWSMIFTSGAYDGENTKGYLKNATYTNPHFTSLLRTAQSSGQSGPTGTVFSDWVLTDSHDGYDTKGIDLVPAIYENNFYYIKDYILDDELFKDSDAEMYWVEGKEYYMRNIATGLFLAGGQWWGTHAALSDYGIRVKPIFDTLSGTYTLSTNIGTGGGYGANDYIDNAGDHLVLRAHRVSPGRFVFKTLDETKAIAAEGTSGWLDGTQYTVYTKEYAEDDEMQMWELIPVDEYFADMISQASVTNGVDISFAIGRWRQNDAEANATWTLSNGKSVSGGLQGQTGDNNNKLMFYFSNAKKGTFAIGWDASWSISKEITNLPDGVYTLSWNALLDNIYDLGMTINNVNVAGLIGVPSTAGTTTHLAAAQAFNEGKYDYTSSKFVVSDGTISIKITCPSHSSATAAAFDNFRLTYYGPDPAQACDLIRRSIDDATARIASLPAELQEGWSADMAKYEAIVESQNVVGDGMSEAMEIYTLLRERVYRNTVEGADFTAAIINNSFEMGTGFGWEFETGNGSVVPNTGDWLAAGTDGDYMYNAWWTGVPVNQILYGLPAGHYKLQALASSSEVDRRWVYFLANGAHSDAIEIPSDNSIFTEVEYEFDVAETGDVNIGMVGAAEDGSYAEFGGRWFKADNFRLTYMGEPSMDSFYTFLEKAIEMATARVNMIPEEYRTGWEDAMAPYRALIENRTLEGDGTREAAEIYALLREHVYAQDFAGADFTPAITNNSFEWGTGYGWTYVGAAESDVKPNSNPTYAVENCDGDYLFNTWNGDDWGSPIGQTMAALPAGRYRLEALLTSDANNGIWLTADRDGDDIPVSQKRVRVNAISKGEFVEASLEFTLDAPTDVTIGAVGATAVGTGYNKDGGRWYKADNFRLTLVAPLATVEWAMEGDVYDTLILPFDAELPEGYEACLTEEMNVETGDDYHVLKLLSSGREIKANVPYIVKKTGLAARGAEVLSFTGVPVNERDSYTVGVLTGTHVDIVASPRYHVLAHSAEGSWFSLDAPRAVSAAHAYISNDDTPDYDFSSPTVYIEKAVDDSDVSTGIEGVIAPDERVAVYTVTGVMLRSDVEASRSLEGLDGGVYIIRGANAIIKTLKR